MWVNLILALKEIGKEVKTFKKNERKDLAEVLDLTADLLLEIVLAFEQDEYPYSKCATVEVLGNTISNHMSRLLKKKNREGIREAFEPFRSLQDEWENRNDPEVIIRLKEAAGEFKGLAALFKI